MSVIMHNYNSKEELETIIKQEIDFEKLNEISRAVGAYLMVDMSFVSTLQMP